MKTKSFSYLRAFLKRMIIRLWIAPFYILVIFPFIILAGEVGGPIERFIFWLVSVLNGNLTTLENIDENNIINATVALFLIVSIIAEAVQYFRKVRTGVSTKVAVMTKLLVCVASWVAAAIASLVNGSEAKEAFMYLVIAGVSAVIFLLEFTARRILDGLFDIAQSIGSSFKIIDIHKQ